MACDLSIVVPLLNEEPVVNILVEKLENQLSQITEKYEIILVDDGSKDKTLQRIIDCSKKNLNVRGLALLRNYGHQTALIAGINESRGDFVVTMDADLQHPPELLTKLFSEIKKGYDLVGTIRIISGASPIKEFFSESFYSVFNFLCNFKIIPNTADYRIISKKVANDIKKNARRHLFLRGFVASRDYKSSYIEFNAQKREFGFSKYNFFKMLGLAVLGITSHSYTPLKFSYLFFGISLLAYFVYAIVYFLSFFNPTIIFFNTSIFGLLILFLVTGIFLNFAIIGEYLTRISQELKNEDLYIIRNKIGHGKEEN